MSAALPYVEELSPPPDPECALTRLSAAPHVLFLDSALRDPKLGRYSFLMADPFDFLTAHDENGDALAALAQKLLPFAAASAAGLPPFQGGAAGMLSYDLSCSLERLPRARFDEFQVPTLAVGLYDVVLALDHVQHRAWIISQGFPETDPGRRLVRAKARADEFRQRLSGPAAQPARPVAPREWIRPEDLSHCRPVGEWPGLLSNFSADEYLATVQRAIDYIYAGDIFQVNLAQRLLAPAAKDSLALYLQLRRCNPATFGAYFDLGKHQIVSASPERLVKSHGGRVEARPIKGTRRRTAWVEADLFAGDELQASEKDRAENIMIVDLLRNDLSRVCRPESVRVEQLCGLESYQYVQHLVSVVSGSLAENKSPLELVRATFPGGSITGAPKVRAMEIITELEPHARGAYCGSLGYLGFDGSLDLNILIRTITAGRGWWQLPVGGGIVAQSVPQREYEETWHKAEGLLRAVCSV